MDEVKIATTGRSFKMTMSSGQQVELYHCDAAAMANTIPRAHFCKCLNVVCVFFCVSVLFFFKIFSGRF